MLTIKDSQLQSVKLALSVVMGDVSVEQKLWWAVDVWLTGLRDWYLRNTLGSSHQNQANGKVTAGTNGSKMNGGVKGQAGGGGALQRRRTTHGVIQQSAYQTETNHHHHAAPHHKHTLPHSATFHGHPLHGRYGSDDHAPLYTQEFVT